MRDRLIENEVKIWLPRDLSDIKIKNDNGELKTDLVVATFTGLTTSWSVVENIKQFLGGANGLTPKKSNYYYDIASVKIPNKNMRLKLFQGKSLYYNYSNVFRSRLYYSDLRCSCIVEISSEELEKLFPNRTIIVLIDCFDLLNLIQSGGSLVDGELVGKYMICGYGTRNRGFRINFEPYVSDLPSVLIGEKLQSGKYVKEDNLIPGRLYSFTRRVTSDYFVYLGKVSKNVLITKAWYNRKAYEPYNLVENNTHYFPYTNLIQPKNLSSELYCFIAIPNYSILQVVNSKGKQLIEGAPAGDLLAISKNRNFLLAENLRGIELMRTTLVPSDFDLCDESLALIAQKFTNNANPNIKNIEGFGQILSLFPDAIWDTPELKKKFIENSAKICSNYCWDTSKRLNQLTEIYKTHEIIGKHITEGELKDTYKKLFPNETI